MRLVTIGAAVVAAITIIVAVGRHERSTAARPLGLTDPRPITLSTTPATYLGVYAAGVPESYSGVTAFTKKAGVKPGVVVYYSGWLESFRSSFAATVAKSGAVPLVQIEPTGISLAAIASGRYDGYLSSYAEAVRDYGGPVILSFGHEMNGSWYSWGYRHASPARFVAAWRHIVSLFRLAGARNVTWLWTVNVISDTPSGKIPDPSRWWPGRSYVNWVGIDGYYYEPSWRFTSLFGTTIVAVRKVTGAPILIAETAAAPATGQPAKIADIFAGVRAYGLLGLVWFDANGSRDWRLNTPAAVAAFRQGAETYKRRP
jgi:hypothetical protein